MDGLFWLFDFFLVTPMTNALIALARVFGGNFGIAIIVFTVIIKAVTWPLTARQYKASRAMQAIQPKVQELQKKYKGKDPKKMQSEMMALYREAGVNPLGCLWPLLVQMPILFALYQVIQKSLGETPEALVTLSQDLYPIPYIHQAVPLTNDFLIWNLGQPDPTYILPLLVGISMYVQQKMVTPVSTTPATTPQQLQQQQTQQMMTWMMPIVFGFMSLQFPSGLALYWSVSNIIGIILQYFYVGRRVDWASMLRFGPAAPAPVPAVRGGGARTRLDAADKPQPKRADEDAASDSDSDDGSEPAAAAAGSERRRKRHGKRRGKR